ERGSVPAPCERARRTDGCHARRADRREAAQRTDGDPAGHVPVAMDRIRGRRMGTVAAASVRRGRVAEADVRRTLPEAEGRMNRVGPSLHDALLGCPQGSEIVRRILERVAERTAMDNLAFTTYQLAAASVARVDAQEGAG